MILPFTMMAFSSGETSKRILGGAIGVEIIWSGGVWKPVRPEVSGRVHSKGISTSTSSPTRTSTGLDFGFDWGDGDLPHRKHLPSAVLFFFLPLFLEPGLAPGFRTLGFFFVLILFLGGRPLFFFLGRSNSKEHTPSSTTVFISSTHWRLKSISSSQVPLIHTKVWSGLFFLTAI